MIESRLNKLAGSGEGVTVFNTLGFDRNDVVRLGDLKASALQDETGALYPVQQTPDGAVAYLRNLPSKGYKTLAAAETAAASPFVHRDNLHLETPFYTVTLDEQGRIVSLFDKEFDKMIEASKDRVRESQSSTFNGQGRHMLSPPSGWS